MSDTIADQAAGWTLSQALGAPATTLKLVHHAAARITELEAERDGYALAIEELTVWKYAEMGTVEDDAEFARILATVDTPAVVQAIRDKAFEEAAEVAEARAGGQPINSDDRLDWGEWRALRQFAAAIRAQQGK